MQISSVASVLLAIICAAANCEQVNSTLVSDDPNKLLNYCLDTINHKPTSAAALLKGECRSWSSNACCSANSTQTAHHTVNHYKFDINMCELETNRQVSPKCQKYFTRDTCFYDCEPNIGPWVVKQKRKFGNERFKHVPLCASECEAWFNACRDEYFCATNLPKQLDWTGDKSVCKEQGKCTRIEERYGTAEYFCESVFDDSWKYTPDDQPCMKLSFEPSKDNPNRRAAQKYLTIHHGFEFSHAASQLNYSLLSHLMAIVITAFLFH